MDEYTKEDILELCAITKGILAKELTLDSILWDYGEKRTVDDILHGLADSIDAIIRVERIIS